MRIVGGRWRGRALAGPPSEAIRPTSDRLRETLFNVLAPRLRDPVPGARVLDLFAGTGAMGLEALSRGAAFALLVDDGAQARGLIRATVEALGLGGDHPRRSAATPPGWGSASPDDPVLAWLLRSALREGPGRRGRSPSCAAGGWLSPGALVVVEEAQGVEGVAPRRVRETSTGGITERRSLYLPDFRPKQARVPDA